MDWIDLDQDRTKCRAVVSTVMNALVQKCGEVLTNSGNTYLEYFIFSP